MQFFIRIVKQKYAIRSKYLYNPKQHNILYILTTLGKNTNKNISNKSTCIFENNVFK